MITVRFVQRLWDGRNYDRLIAELLAARVESSPRIASRLTGSTAAAALGLIRLDELNQSHTPIAQTMLRCVIASQTTDGGWNDPLLCALCLRALLTARGQGLAIQRGLAWLAAMQRPEGIWPAEPFRRMPGDALVSAFILMQLAGNEQFRQTVRFDEACMWFEAHTDELEGEIVKIWHHASLRAAGRRHANASLWS
ncbi:hypothetical protein BH09PLA1_BH09PLA1_32350 [soil metagenome]